MSVNPYTTLIHFLIWFAVYLFPRLSIDLIRSYGTNINKLIYADDTILMAEREELKSLLLKVKE